MRMRRRTLPETERFVASTPRILCAAAAFPSNEYTQDIVCAEAQLRLLGPDWRDDAAKRERGEQIAHLFAATQVERRRGAVELFSYYQRQPTTGERMADYAAAGYTLGREAMERCLGRAEGMRTARDISDLFLVSCTGYAAPGLDIRLARDLDMARDVRRVTIGHMGCHGALVGLRQSLAAVRAHPGATAALLSVELASLHYSPTLEPDVLTAFALFGDAAAAVLVSDAPAAAGPELVDTYCAAEFDAAAQMTWTITDHGFVMGLSPRVPVTLRRTVAGVVEHLLAPHGLTARDVTHWLVHPGGPSILEAIQARLELRDEQMALSWRVLHEHGNCSSVTVLLILDELMRAGAARQGEWGVMMAFGPGLTLETCLLRF
jgi:predicted naringenin-chalcone synthase